MRGRCYKIICKPVSPQPRARNCLSEYDRWAKKHPNDARMMGGFLFYRHLQKDKVGAARFPCGWRRQVANRSQLAAGRLED
jgi:hypothetical protein